METELCSEAEAAWWLAMELDLDVDLGELRPAFDELADAMLVWVDDPELERITVPALEAIWTSALQSSIEAGLVELGEHSGSWRKEATRALADLRRRGRASEIAFAVAQTLALHLGNEDQPFGLCVCCLDEWIAAAPSERRRQLALECAPLLRRDAAVPEAELRAAMRACAVGAVRREPPESLARLLATDERLAAVRARAARIARLAASGESHFAAALNAILIEPPGRDPARDELWVATCNALVADLETGMS
jgi:hypothetical protein